MVAIAVGTLLVAVGAVLVWGVDRTVGGVEVTTIGVILMAVGAIGVAASLLLSARATPRPRATPPRESDSLTAVEVKTRRDEEAPPFGRRWPH
jgi:thiol:disulfide interchange protein